MQQRNENFSARFTMRKRSLDELLGRAHAALAADGFEWEAQQLSMIRTLAMGQWPEGKPPQPGVFDSEPDL